MLRSTSLDSRILLQSSLSRSKRSVYLSCACLLLSVVFKKIAFYSLTCNLVLTLNGRPFYWISYNASNALLIFMGVSFVCSFLGGCLTDKVGKFPTIFASYCIYILGYAVFPVIGYAQNFVFCVIFCFFRHCRSREILDKVCYFNDILLQRVYGYELDEPFPIPFRWFG